MLFMFHFKQHFENILNEINFAHPMSYHLNDANGNFNLYSWTKCFCKISKSWLVVCFKNENVALYHFVVSRDYHWHITQ